MAQVPVVRARERTRKANPQSFRYLAATWRPDWKDARAYRKKRTFAEWAWEFLRRNPRYEQFYLASMVKYERQPELIREAERLTLERDESGNFPEAPDDPQLAKFFKIMEAGNMWYSLLNFPRPPWQDKVELKIEGIAYCLGGNSANAELVYPRKDEVLCLFGLHLPIKAQLKEIEKILVREKKRLGLSDEKSRENIYPNYLRILDAKLAGAKSREIAEEISAGSGLKVDTFYRDIAAVRDGYRAARALSSFGWKSLLFKED